MKIFIKNYKTKFALGVNWKTDSELVENKCPTHPKLNIEIIEEENYFFLPLSRKLLKLYREQTDFVLPSYRLKEIQDFVKKVSKI